MSEAVVRQSSEEFSESRVKPCDLCGLPIGASKARQVLSGKVMEFCCPGCLNVYQILLSRPEETPFNFKETDLYQTCVEFGLIPGKQNSPSREEFTDAPKETAPKGLAAGALFQEMTFSVEGMWCPSCSWVIEQALRKTRGVIEARVMFLSDQAQIKYLPQEVHPQTILAQVSKLGYSPTSGVDPFENLPKRKNPLIRLGISSILTMNIMMISFFLYYGFFDELAQEAIPYFSYPLWFLSSVVLFYGGFPVFTRAYHGIRYGSVSMDMLITIGALAAYGYSMVQILKGSLYVYFDTASMLITLVLAGRFIESKARENVSTGLKELYRLAGQKVRLLQNGLQRWVSPEAVLPGAEFLIAAGERVPLDARIVSGRAKMDESILTGESRPVTKDVGDEIMAGTLLLERELTLKATGTSRDSTLEQMIRLIQEALSGKNPFELYSDRIMRWFVPIVLALAGGTALSVTIQGVSIDVALLRAVTVLVITCPCALGIASPLAKVAAVGKGRHRGILIRDPKALEQAKDLDVMVFDKTGTLTEGNFSMIDLVSKRTAMEEALKRIAAVEMQSDHYLAREVVRKAKELGLKLEEAQCFEAFDGLGVKGCVQGVETLVGNRPFIRAQDLDLSVELDREARFLETQGMTVVFFGWDREAQGFLIFGDALKANSRKTVQKLQKRGIEVWLISGDAKETTRVVGRKLGIKRIFGQALAKDKVQMIEALQKKGQRVGMVGDGLNDAAALARADVGLALGTSLHISREASDITLMSGDPARITEVLDLSALTGRIIRQNLVFAFLYNGLALPLAITGLLNPLVAVLAMFASSLCVIGNSYRISRKATNNEQ